MKVIGLIGGLSWVSTVEYYKIINEEINKRLGGLSSAKCIIYSVNFEEIVNRQLKNDWKGIGELLANAALALQRAGADFVLICANTMHKVADYIESKISIPLLHIADATAKEILKKNISIVGLLGTKTTMEEDFYKKRIEKYGINVIIPDETDREKINNIIYQELCKNLILEKSKREFLNIIKKLVDRGAEGIILGCTELPLLAKGLKISIPLFDTTKIHALSAVEYALSDE